MNKCSFFLTLLISSFVSAQNVDIYSKWVAYPNENTQLILDLTERGFIKVKHLEVYDYNNYRLDSFGYKRKCFGSFKDLDSSRVFWIAKIESLHPNIQEGMSVGEFLITETNWEKIPISMKMIDELPELNISFAVGDTLQFTRMLTKTPEEVSRCYRTFYGGSVEETIYLGEYSGESGAQKNIGMHYRLVGIDAVIKKNLFKKTMSVVNSLRKQQDLDTLIHDSELDFASTSEIKKWLNEMNNFHRVDIYGLENDKKNQIDSFSTIGEYTFIQYPFQCGRNLMLVISNSNFNNSRRKSLRYIKKNHNVLIEKSVSEMMNKKGAKQNILNEGYSTVGFDFRLIKGSFDDFYFDEDGRKISIKRKRNPYYYFLLSQKFSVSEYQ